MDEAPEDAALFTKAVGDVARARGMMQLARDTGITREGLYKALGEQGNPSFATVVKVMHALGLQFHVGARADSLLIKYGFSPRETCACSYQKCSKFLPR